MVQEKDPSLGVLGMMVLSKAPPLMSSMRTDGPAASSLAQVISWPVPGSQVSPPLGVVTVIDPAWGGGEMEKFVSLSSLIEGSDPEVTRTR